MVGGSGAINGQVMLRGLLEDFEGWAAWGNDEWSYRKVLPYFKKMECDLDIQDDVHGTGGLILCRRRSPGRLFRRPFIKLPWP